MFKNNKMNVLIVYGTIEGQTRKIAGFLKQEAEKMGDKASLCDATDNPVAPDEFDAVIITSSLHAHKYNAAVVEYAVKNQKVLNERPSMFISVSLTAAADEEKSWQELKQLTGDFLTGAGWTPTKVQYVAGALRYTQYDFFKRFIMRMIVKKQGGETDTSRDHEYTDWEELKLTFKDFLEAIRKK